MSMIVAEEARSFAAKTKLEFGLKALKINRLEEGIRQGRRNAAEKLLMIVAIANFVYVILVSALNLFYTCFW